MAGGKFIMAKQFIFVAPISRRMPDPVHDTITRYVFFTPVRSVPRDLPLDPNAREPKVRLRVYKDVAESLMDRDGVAGTFHLKNKGITVVADRVEKLDDDRYKVTITEGQGILDGGHTYELLCLNLDNPETPEQQFVKWEIVTNVDPSWIPDLSRGLNTSVQVQPMSLDNLAGQFDWIKDELADEPYIEQIAWKENDPGEYDARDIVALLTCFDITRFPNGGSEHPVMAHDRKSRALKEFERRPDDYRKLRPLLKDILVLHDEVRYGSQQIWNTGSHKFGGLSYVEKKPSKFTAYFIDKEQEYRLMNGALYPILAAFRWMVEEDKDAGVMRWRGGFESVQQRWQELGEELLEMTYQTSAELRGNPNSLGKSRSLWSNLHSRIAVRELMQTAASD
jgi:hypothetical protein